MGRTFFMVCAIALGFHGAAWGRPPSSIDLTYNSGEKNFIVNTSKYSKQTSAAMLISDIPLDAVSGDVLRVKAFCNDAGSREQTLIVQ